MTISNSRRLSRHRRGKARTGCQDLGIAGGDDDGVLEVGAGLAVSGDGGPAVAEDVHFGHAHVDHGFDGENHARLETELDLAVVEVGDLGLFVELLADAVAYELLDDGIT